MPHSAADAPFSPALQGTLAWLGQPPAQDPLRDLVPLRNHLAALADGNLSPVSLLRVLDLFQLRTDAITNVLEPLLLDATLPLPRRLRTVAKGLIEIHRPLAEGYLRVLREASPAHLAPLKRSQSQVGSAAMANLARQYQVALMVAAPAPADLWKQGQEILRRLTPASGIEIMDVERHVKGMMALAAAQPESFSPREIAFLAEYLDTFAAAIEIRLKSPKEAAEWYWLAEERDQPPTAAARRPPPPDARLVFYSCRVLGRKTRGHLAQLAHGVSPESMGLPACMAQEDYRHTLAQAEAHWSSPPQRQAQRRRNSYRVQACVHLGTLWQILHGKPAESSREFKSAATDWMVLNESPEGLAMMHVSGKVEGLVAGGTLGLKFTADGPWNICLVRWARSENPEHVEIGLELVAPHAEAVHWLPIPQATPSPTPMTALLLPAVPTLGRREALLVARGHYTARDFMLIGELDGRTRIVECAAGALTLQTASIEIFEFERKVAD